MAEPLNFQFRYLIRMLDERCEIKLDFIPAPNPTSFAQP
jgi:hypothetical protein